MLHVVAHTLTAVLYGVYGYAHHASFFRLVSISCPAGPSRVASGRGCRDCRAVQCDAPTRHANTRQPHAACRHAVASPVILTPRCGVQTF